MRRLAALVALLAAPAWAEQELADELARKRACITSHANVQRARAAQRFAEARKHADFCAAAGCPDILRSECSTWASELAAEQPTIVLSVRDDTGRPLPALAVRLDDRLLARHGDGQPIEVDPGWHTLRFDGREQQILVRAGDKGRLVELVVPAPRKSPPAGKPVGVPGPRPSPGLPATSWILGGIAAAGFLSAAYFGVSGMSQQRRLEGTCAPRCPRDDVDDMQRSYAIADVSLGVGLVAAAGAVWVALAGTSAPPQEAR